MTAHFDAKRAELLLQAGAHPRDIHRQCGVIPDANGNMVAPKDHAHAEQLFAAAEQGATAPTTEQPKKKGRGADAERMRELTKIRIAKNGGETWPVEKTCKAIAKSSGKRCRRLAIKGVDHCILHGGGRALAKRDDEILSNPKLQGTKKWQVAHARWLKRQANKDTRYHPKDAKNNPDRGVIELAAQLVKSAGQLPASTVMARGQIYAPLARLREYKTDAAAAIATIAVLKPQEVQYGGMSSMCAQYLGLTDTELAQAEQEWPAYCRRPEYIGSARDDDDDDERF
ncbi:hypothetical protein [Ruegeria sp. HKCCA5426]|uniref:hypothetical protein n=1 Tax=Ruegeria sp. HKCCA5426 TaxID=2682985 RepID=UPI0014890334|nr:hypothetical protein [Ruegeria sp. HKCCA5426]